MMTIKKITIVEPTVIAGKGVAAGVSLDVPGQVNDKDARYLIAIGKAVEADEKPDKDAIKEAKALAKATTTAADKARKAAVGLRNAADNAPPEKKEVAQQKADAAETEAELAEEEASKAADALKALEG